MNGTTPCCRPLPVSRRSSPLSERRHPAGRVGVVNQPPLHRAKLMREGSTQNQKMTQAMHLVTSGRCSFPHPVDIYFVGTAGPNLLPMLPLNPLLAVNLSNVPCANVLLVSIRDLLFHRHRRHLLHRGRNIQIKGVNAYKIMLHRLLHHLKHQYHLEV